MYEAIKSFSGAVSMAVGGIKDIKDVDIVKDLLKAGYIREVKPAKVLNQEPKAAEVETEAEPKAKAKKPATRAKKSGVK